MATPTDTNRNLLTVIARMRAKAGKEQELRDSLVALLEPTTKEKGYGNYDLHQGVEDPRWFFFENWESADHLDKHLQAPHLVEFAGRLDDLIDESGPLVIERVRRIA